MILFVKYFLLEVEKSIQVEGKMSYQVRSKAVSLVSGLLILVFYSTNLFRMNQNGNFNSVNVYNLWATIIVLSIIITVVSHILVNLLYGLVRIIRTKEVERFITDERDKFIVLKGTRNAYLAFGLGVFMSMGTLVINMSPLVMFNLLIFSGILAKIIGDCSRIYLYWREM